MRFLLMKTFLELQLKQGPYCSYMVHKPSIDLVAVLKLTIDLVAAGAWEYQVAWNVEDVLRFLQKRGKLDVVTWHKDRKRTPGDQITVQKWNSRRFVAFRMFIDCDLISSVQT